MDPQLKLNVRFSLNWNDTGVLSKKHSLGTRVHWSVYLITTGHYLAGQTQFKHREHAGSHC